MLDPLLRGHAGKIVCCRTKHVSPQQDRRAAREVAVAGIGNLADWLIGKADSAIYLVILLPEPAFELKPQLDGGRIGHCHDRGPERRADLYIKLGEDGQRMVQTQ